MDFIGRFVLIVNLKNHNIDYKKNLENKQTGSMTDEMYPIRTEYNKVKDTIVVCTRKDVRFIDAKTGRLGKILTGLLKNQEDEISQFRSQN